MIGKKINQLATELAPVSTDLTIIGDPISGVSKKITLAQLGAIFSGAVSFYTDLASFPVVGDINVIYCAKDTQKLYLWSGSAYTEVFPSQALLDTYQLRSEKGNANGYASLDSGGKVPISQLPSSIMEYKGMWNASTNTPTLANGTGDTGDVYICNVAGTVNFGAGPITFAVGDYVIYSGTIWQRSSGAVGTVTSVAATITGDSVTISGSPVTTSGTLAFAFSGTTAQYIRGNGTLATFPSLTGFVPYTGATANVDLGTHTLLAKDLVINHSSGSGVAASITKGGSGEALTVVKSSGSGNAASITGGVTLLSELHLTTDLADAYIASATNWNAAYNDKINSAAVTGTTTKTLTLTQQDGGTITASWTDDNTDAVTSVFGRTGAVVATSGDYNTSQVTENTNLYFTNARAIASTLTGYTSGAGTITSSDSILSAIQKLNGNIGALTTGVSSVNGLTGAVTLTTSNIAEGTNLYYTEARVNANTNVAANTAARHNAVTLGTANGLSLSTQVLSLGLASTSTTGALSSTDWNTFNNKTSNTGTVTSVGLSSATSGVTIGSTPITTSGTITLAIATASGSQQGLLSSTDWTTFNNKQNALTNPVTGTGTTNYLPKFTGTSTIGNSQIFDTGSEVRIFTTSTDARNFTLGVYGVTWDNTLLEVANDVTVFNKTSADNGSLIEFRTVGGQRGDIRATTSSFSISSRTSLIFGSNNTDNMRLDASGNLGLGVSPSAWSSAFGSVLQFKSAGSNGGGSLTGSGGSNFRMFANTFYDGSYKYIVNGTATQYEQDGYHAWFTAPSGTAGNAISFTQAMTLNASGNLSIGNTNDSFKLDVTGTGRFTSNLNVNGVGDFNTSSSSTYDFAIRNSGTGNTRLRFGNATSTARLTITLGATGSEFARIGPEGPFPLYLQTNGTDRLTIDGSTGAATFSTSIAVGSLSLSGSTMQSSGDYYIGTNNSNFIQFYTSNANRMIISAAGNVGIGTTAPSDKLQMNGGKAIFATSNFNGTTAGGSVFVFSDDNNGGKIWAQKDGNQSWGYLALQPSGGNVGIGSTSPSYLLDVAGNFRFINTSSGSVNGYYTAANTGSITLNFGGTTTPDKGRILYSDNSDIFAFYTASTERMRITSGGNVEINTGSIKTGEPDTGWGRAAIKIGAKVSGEAFNVDYYLPVSVDGTVYYINLNSSTP
jgi:hypothetical protein